jgi:hypothetical protein
MITSEREALLFLESCIIVVKVNAWSNLEHLPMLKGKTNFFWGSNTSPQDITLEGKQDT